MRFGFVLAVALFSGSVARAGESGGDELLRTGYDSAATGQRREYFVYLPVDYRKYSGRRWPVMLFLHGNGERGDGLTDLDYVLQHGPLMEAWIQRRPLPFIIISPQMPVFDQFDAIAGRNAQKRPQRLPEAVPERNYGFPSDLPIQRTSAEDFPPGPYADYDPYQNPGRLPPGWEQIDEELISMVDAVLKAHRADPTRVYLTGLSMGAFGALHLAARYPERWAAMATIVGTGRVEDAAKLAEAGLPIWMFGGGKDTVVKPHWLYRMARALEEANHPALRFTVHEDMDHDAWKRVYAGQDLYDWFLRYRSDARPSQPEKSM